MKIRTSPAAIVAAFCLLATPAAAVDWENAEFYPFEEATLVYSASGMQTGTQTMYIKGYGRETAQYQDMTMNMMGMSQATKTASWTDSDWVYTYDFGTGQGTKMKNPIQDMFKNTDDPKEAYMSFLTGMGGQEVGTDSHNGTTCTKYQVMMATLCISDDLIMQYTRMEMMGMSSNVELVSVDIGDVDDSKFDKPDVTFNEMEMPTGMPFGN